MTRPPRPDHPDQDLGCHHLLSVPPVLGKQHRSLIVFLSRKLDCRRPSWRKVRSHSLINVSPTLILSNRDSPTCLSIASGSVCLFCRTKSVLHQSIS
ncbi:hypothetical protein GALMADRAFT_286490 [Galerina marginata CBS 339.88]|uniref:Uncharacterized protein n=1 Tax=Galerina marginata (strain CBS 339.88) TaxID=685588 RepID=A0A067TNH9_GALM3|nr:hypothetical protein GALMADRAFT_286490 [Galerina marginata CBS 339.88]